MSNGNTKRLFEILDAMNLADCEHGTSNLGVCSTLISADYVAKNGGTQVAIGAPGNIVHDIQSGKTIAIMILVDSVEYEKFKKQ